MQSCQYQCHAYHHAKTGSDCDKCRAMNDFLNTPHNIQDRAGAEAVHWHALASCTMHTCNLVGTNLAAL